MIRLIASDVDGTLVPEGTSQVDPQLFHLILQLKERGIRFVAASGRQYASIVKAFDPVKDEIFFIADNGSFVVEKGQFLVTNTFPEDVWKAIIRHVHTVPGPRSWSPAWKDPIPTAGRRDFSG
ncbi:MAG: HAD-IIB family hydrolase [Parasporobacterium sp.]|nr:HAD-IIB family hydrolase [Parasporobacterium sp.]